jgi:tetratricopeptide (TPR) repeat protein
MKVENGQALMNGQTILAMENIPLYNRNETVQKLLKEKEELDQEFADLAGLGDSAPVQRLRQKNAEKRGEIVKQLQELEMEMLDLCKHMEENRSFGKKLNWREKKAMELMDTGNYDAAKAILRDELWSSEVQHAKQIMSGAEEIIDEYISGKKALIQTIKATGVNKESAKEIILIYEDICQLAEKIQAELEVFIDFAVFLWKQHQYPRAIDVCDKGMLLLKLTKGPAEQIAKAKWLLGAIYDRQNESEKAEKLFRDALTDFQDLEKEYPGKYQEDIAGICNSLALIFYMRQQMDEAEAMHRAALKIRRTLAQGNHNIFDDGLAASCNNLGIVLMQKKEYEEAQSLLSEALKIRENLAANYPNQYESSLAKTYKNLGNLAKNKNQLSEAEHYYRKTIELFGKLKSVNPDAYEHDYANACERLAKLYQRLKQYDEAEKLYEEAEEIYSRWSSENFEAYGKYLGNLYHQWAELYSVKHQYEDAKTMYGKAYDLYAALEKSSPQMYLRKLSWIHGDIEKLERKKDKNVL